MHSDSPENDVELVVVAAFGLEALVVRELAELGYTDTKVEDGRIRFRGPLDAICRCNIWLRCAERVQVLIGEYPAVDFDQLFDGVKVLEWERWLPVDAKFPVHANCVRSEIRSPMNVQKMVKRAIVERLRKVYLRHKFAEDGVEFSVDCNIVRDKVMLTLDTSGSGLHKRGYRQLVGAAPLRETVAAALVKLSYWESGRLLVDPFCGSGTIPIEAALIGRNMAPGANRSFSAENWPQLPGKMWSEVRREARDLIKPNPSLRIIARDRDKRVVKIAKMNAKEAGVFSNILFENKEFFTFPTNRDYGVTVCNPPYGERIGQRDEVRQLHADMGELMGPLDTWSHYILTSAENFEREFGRRADRRRKIYNARLACTYYQYLGPRPPGQDSQAEDADQDGRSDEELAIEQSPVISIDTSVAAQPPLSNEETPDFVAEDATATAPFDATPERSDPGPDDGDSQLSMPDGEPTPHHADAQHDDVTPTFQPDADEQNEIADRDAGLRSDHSELGESGPEIASQQKSESEIESDIEQVPKDEAPQRGESLQDMIRKRQQDDRDPSSAG